MIFVVEKEIKKANQADDFGSLSSIIQLGL